MASPMEEPACTLGLVACARGQARLLDIDGVSEWVS